MINVLICGPSFATIANVIQYRRLAALVVGIWLGAGVFADIAVTQNFATVDRFLATRTGDMNRPAERLFLRRNAGEENNFLFANWELAELGIGAALLLVVFRGGRVLMGLTVAMLAIVCVQHFYLSPEITELGRQEPVTAHFWMLHGIYSGIEILKLGLGAVLALVTQRG
jgi:hypothetical protein